MPAASPVQADDRSMARLVRTVFVSGSFPLRICRAYFGHYGPPADRAHGSLTSVRELACFVHQRLAWMNAPDQLFRL